MIKLNVKSILTKRELEIISFLQKGYGRKKIASSLGLSLHTVNTHIKNAYRKLGVSKVTELIHCMNKN